MAAKKTVSRSEFVQSFPASMSPQDVVAEGAKKGVTLSVKTVSAIRNIARATAARKAKRAAGGAPKRGPGRPKGSKNKAPAKKARAAGSSTNKSAFVRSLPDSMSLKDVVARAKAQGLTLSEKHVSAIRSLARAKLRTAAPGSAPKRGPGRPPGSRNRPRAASGPGFEHVLAELVLEHGARQIEQALEAIRDRLKRSLA
jgi:hypothetical protein